MINEEKELENQENLVEEAPEETIIEETPVEEEPTELDQMTNNEIEEIPEVKLDISLEGPDLVILFDSITNYISFLKDNLKKANSIVIDDDFNKKVQDKIVRSDQLRHLIKKGVIIVDKDKPIYSLKDEGEVIGIETFTKTQEGAVTEEAKPITVGSTPEVKVPKQTVPTETVVQSVSEEL